MGWRHGVSGGPPGKRRRARKNKPVQLQPEEVIEVVVVESEPKPRIEIVDEDPDLISDNGPESVEDEIYFFEALPSKAVPTKPVIRRVVTTKKRRKKKK
jgi:hypothetical protein